MTSATTNVDIMSEAVAGDPWPLLRQIRELGPVVWHDDYGRWLVTTDSETRSVLSNFQRFTVQGTVVETLFGKDAFISLDDRTRHNELRAVWTKAFRHASLQMLRPAIESIVDRLMDTVAARLRNGEVVDIGAAFCRPLPTAVIALMMGVPESMLPDVVRWSDAMASGGPSYLSESNERDLIQQTCDAAKVALASYLLSLIQQRRQRPTDDLISELVHSAVGQTLPDDHLMQNVRQLLFAGNETSAKWLSQIFLTYGERPELQTRLRADPELIFGANDEVMRLDPPVGTLVRRVCGGPITVAGVDMADGDDVTCLIGSANRDPARYLHPDAFLIGRAATPNIGFGFGFHVCLGLPLAKLEADIALRRFLANIPPYVVAGPYSYTSLPMRGPQPVTIALEGS